jgi:hypothetical protein
MKKGFPREESMSNGFSHHLEVEGVKLDAE